MSTTTRDTTSGPVTLQALLADEAFASDLAELDRLRAEERRRVREIRRLLDVRSALINYELGRRIVAALGDHPEGLCRRELVEEMTMAHATRFFEETLARLVKKGLVKRWSDVRPDVRGHPRRQVVFGLTPLAPGMGRRRLEETLGRPGLPQRPSLRVIEGGEP